MLLAHKHLLLLLLFHEHILLGGSAVFSNLRPKFLACFVQETRLSSFQNGTSLPLIDKFTGFVFCQCDLSKGSVNVYGLYQLFFHI